MRARDSGSTRAGWAGACALLLLWFRLLDHLRVEWTINPQYSFGWGVPFLALYLFWKRWQDRPLPVGLPGAPVLVACAVVLALGFLPIRLVQEANPDWRLISWLLALSVVGLTWAGIFFAGGSRWFRHFLVPAGLILLAVPWPTQAEQAVVQTLMRGVTAATAEGMNWLGIAAEPRGNLIELGNGRVGVNEACSGVRSFQATLMTAVFAGEIYRLTAGRRALLLMAGLAWAILLNLGRTSFLTWLAARGGSAGPGAWHDPAGYVTLGLAVVGVLALGFWCGRTEDRAPEAEPARADSNSESLSQTPSPTLPEDIPFLAKPSTIGATKSASHSVRSDAKPLLPAWQFSAALTVWFLLAEGAVELWYRSHERSSQGGCAWRVAWPGAEDGFRARELAESVRVILRCDESQAGLWKRNDGSEWTMFFLRWRPGRMAARLAKGHTPDVCLPASGFRQVAQLGFAPVQVHEIQLPFHTYVFENDQRTCYVFFCVADETQPFTPERAKRAARTYVEELERSRRWQAVVEGRRHRGQQVLEIAMTGYSTQEQARQALVQSLPSLIRLEPGDPRRETGGRHSERTRPGTVHLQDRPGKLRATPRFRGSMREMFGQNLSMNRPEGRGDLECGDLSPLSAGDLSPSPERGSHPRRTGWPRPGWPTSRPAAKRRQVAALQEAVAPSIARSGSWSQFASNLWRNQPAGVLARFGLFKTDGPVPARRYAAATAQSKAGGTPARRATGRFCGGCGLLAAG